ncbi:Creatinase/Aminopeptidase P, partial [Staphylotrichum tortipilum]
MDFNHDLVLVDEFDALSIEVKPAASSRPRSARGKEVKPKSLTPGNAGTSKPNERVLGSNTLDMAWLHKDLGKFPAKTHARRVAKELGVKSGLIYLLGQEEKLYEDSDMSPDFYYLAGADFPGCAVTYDIAQDYLILWVPRMDPRTVLWYGRTPSLDECKAAYDVDSVRFIGALDRTLRLVITPGTVIYALHPDQAPKLEGVKKAVHIDTTKLKPAMDNARVIKTDYEIALIRRANAVS